MQFIGRIRVGQNSPHSHAGEAPENAYDKNSGVPSNIS